MSTCEEYYQNTHKSPLNGKNPELNYNLLPQKSRKHYENKYSNFKDWCEKNNTTNITESVLIDYFTNKLQSCSSMWSVYSMLKCTLSLHDNVDISKFNKLKTFIKNQGVGYRAKRSSVFSREEITRFLSEAPNDRFLMWKVALIMGVAGACRCNDLINMKMIDIQELGDVLLVNVPQAKHSSERTFLVTNNLFPYSAIDIYRKYKSLRPSHMNHERLFIYYKYGRCTIQPVGINTMTKVPSFIAEFLNLPNPESYTGHCFRRTSSFLLGNDRGNFLRLQRLAGWPNNVPVSEAKESENACTNQEDGCRMNLRKTKPKSALSANASNEWIFEEEMNFLQPYLNDRTTTTVVSSSDEEQSTANEITPQHIPETVMSNTSEQVIEQTVSDDDGSTNDESTFERSANTHKRNLLTKQNISVEKKSKVFKEKSKPKVLMKYLLHKKSEKLDEVETLFYSLAQTVKKMDPYYRALAKSRVCSIIGELEIQNIATQSLATPSYTISVPCPSPTPSDSSSNVSTPVHSPSTSESQTNDAMT